MWEITDHPISSCGCFKPLKCVTIIPAYFAPHSEALPFFLLLIDLSKASSLAKFAFRSGTKVHCKIVTRVVLFDIAWPSCACGWSYCL